MQTPGSFSAQPKVVATYVPNFVASEKVISNSLVGELIGNMSKKPQSPVRFGVPNRKHTSVPEMKTDAYVNVTPCSVSGEIGIV